MKAHPLKRSGNPLKRRRGATFRNWGAKIYKEVSRVKSLGPLLNFDKREAKQQILYKSFKYIITKVKLWGMVVIFFKFFWGASGHFLNLRWYFAPLPPLQIRPLLKSTASNTVTSILMSIVISLNILGLGRGKGMKESFVAFQWKGKYCLEFSGKKSTRKKCKNVISSWSKATFYV